MLIFWKRCSQYFVYSLPSWFSQFHDFFFLIHFGVSDRITRRLLKVFPSALACVYIKRNKEWEKVGWWLLRIFFYINNALDYNLLWSGNGVKSKEAMPMVYQNGSRFCIYQFHQIKVLKFVQANRPYKANQT